MADNAREGHVAFDTVFTDLVRAETRLYNAVAERVKAEAGVGAGHFEMLRYVRDHQGQGARVADHRLHLRDRRRDDQQDC